MNAFVRQIAVLAVLWAVCELLLPDDRQQRMARLTLSILVMTAFLTALNGLLSMGQTPAAAAQAPCTGQEPAPAADYGRTALRALANQAGSYCRRMAERAGYEGEAVVWLKQDGGLERIDLTLRPGQAPLLEASELRRALAKALQVEEEKVCLQITDGADSS